MATSQGGKAHRGGGGRIEVILPSKPKRLYCAGPPPPRITLVPPRDSTAYIISKLVLPSVVQTAAEITITRRLYYTVGWTDLPSAKVVVLATRILDYVSPRELEDWEYKDFLRREEEKKLAESKAAATPVKQKKKPGRPRKGPSDSQREAEADIAKQAAVLDSETEAILAEKKAGGGPSLSTPSKRKLEELLRDTDAEDTGAESENAAIMRQLYPDVDEREYPSEAQYEDQMDIDSEAVDLVGPTSAEEDLSSRASSLAAPARAPLARTSPALSGSLKPSSAASSVAISSGPASRPDIKGRAAAAGGAQEGPTPFKEAKPESRTSTRASTPRTSAYFPAPSRNGAPSPRRHSTGFTPVITPVPVPVRPSPLTHASPPVFNNNIMPSPSAEESQPLPTSGKNRSPKKRKKQRQAKEEEAEDGWAVKRLEGDKYDYNEAGNLVRYFKVLWEGDWPPWQNPTWEPEENIPEELRQEYLKKQESKMKNGYLTTGKSPGKTPMGPRPAFLPKKRYSNVAEAFEGEIHELEDAKGVEAEDDDQDAEETFVVTDEPQLKPGMKAGPNFLAFDQKLASYRDTFGR